MLNFVLPILFLGLMFSLGRLDITVKNIRAGKGHVIIEVYDNEKDFFMKPRSRKSIEASEDSLSTSFSLPNGVYAIAIYQDLNNNEKLDKGLFGAPKEPYGLSNNFRPVFSAPRFEDCKFKLDGRKEMTILLK